MIETSKVSVSFGTKRVLHDVDFTACPGEVTVIVGPNGSGKTTFLKALSGDVKAKGSIRFNGSELCDLKPWQAAAMRGVLPQATTLSLPFTVREIVSLGLTGGRSGVTAAEAGLLPERALARVDLEGFAGRFYQELSGGEQQRVQLARVLCQVWAPVLDNMPRWLFLDEPVSSLDIKHQLVIMNIARDFAQAGGGVIAILHDLNLASMYADRVLMISKGRVAALGRPADVFADDLLCQVFECPLRVGVLPANNAPFMLPQSVA